jgi:hypothetical protein
MKRLIVACVALWLGAACPAWAQVPMDRRGHHGDRIPCCGQDPSWHGSFYDMTYGAPIALVVPPTAELQSHWGWGVGNTRMTVNCPQFNRNYYGPGVYDRRAFLARRLGQAIRINSACITFAGRGTDPGLDHPQPGPRTLESSRDFLIAARHSFLSQGSRVFGYPVLFLTR